MLIIILYRVHYIHVISENNNNCKLVMYLPAVNYLTFIPIVFGANV